MAPLLTSLTPAYVLLFFSHQITSGTCKICAVQDDLNQIWLQISSIRKQYASLKKRMVHTSSRMHTAIYKLLYNIYESCIVISVGYFFFAKKPGNGVVIRSFI